MGVITRSTAGINANSGRYFASIADVLSGTDQIKSAARTNTNDLTSEINKLLLEVSTAGGGRIVFPAGNYFAEGIIPQNGVALVGAAISRYYSSTVDSFSTTLKATIGAVPLFNQDSGSLRNFGVSGFNINGVGATGTAGLMHFLLGYRVTITACTFNWSSAYFVKQDAGDTLQLVDCVGENGFLASTVYGNPIGGFDINGTDSILDRVELTTSATSMPSSGNISSINLGAGGGNHDLSHIRVFMSETGLRISSGVSRLSDIRILNNRGHGLILTGGGNQLTNLYAAANGQQTVNTYDGINVPSAANNSFQSCRSNGASQQRFGFTDLSDSGATAVYPQYQNCRGRGNVSGTFNFPNAGVSYVAPTGPPVRFPSGDLTPNVENYSNFSVSGDDAYTDFIGAPNGQMLYIYTGGWSGASFVYGTIKTLTGTTLALTAYKAYGLQKIGAVWVQLF